jgi:hypothetical protein
MQIVGHMHAQQAICGVQHLQFKPRFAAQHGRVNEGAGDPQRAT